jgi:hypothetical protein
MTADIHAANAHVLITIIAMLIPLLIWAFRDAEDKFSEMRAELLRRWDRQD